MKNFDLDKAIRKIPDFPKPGVLFYDITSILADPEAFTFCVNSLGERYDKSGIDGVAAVEARGFLFAAPYAINAGIPLILIRKKGKLPGKTVTASYSLEYGEAEIQLHVDDIQKGKNYLLVDDLIATGGTLKAAADLIKQAGGEVRDIFGVVGLPFLNFAGTLNEYTVTTLIDYHSE